MVGGAGEPVGSARLELVSGVALLREEDAVLEAMLAGWARRRLGGARAVGQDRQPAAGGSTAVPRSRGRVPVELDRRAPG